MRIMTVVSSFLVIFLTVASFTVALNHQPAVADDPLSGTFTMTGSGSGTYDMDGPLTGTATLSTTIDGDAVGAFITTLTYNYDDDAWIGTIGQENGTLTVPPGGAHTAAYFGRTDEGGVDLTLDHDLWIMSVDFTGSFFVSTTDDSNIAVDANWTGSVVGDIEYDVPGPGEWVMTNITGGGTWSGTLYDLPIPPAVEQVDPGSNTVLLDTVARLDLDVTDSGNILLAQYDGNPQGVSAKTPLGKYIEVNTDLSPYSITWPVELRVYYNELEVAAAGIDEITMRMYTWNGLDWEVLPDSGVNIISNYIWGMLDHFSTYSPMGDPADSEGGGCFIATAAYGTPTAEEIDVLRDFRDQYLVTNPVGKALVELYYDTSPPMADFIAEHPALKQVVRTNLEPAIAVSSVVVNTNLAQKIAILSSMILLSSILVFRLRRRAIRG